MSRMKYWDFNSSILWYLYACLLILIQRYTIISRIMRQDAPLCEFCHAILSRSSKQSYFPFPRQHHWHIAGQRIVFGWQVVVNSQPLPNALMWIQWETVVRLQIFIIALIWNYYGSRHFTHPSKCCCITYYHFYCHR